MENQFNCHCNQHFSETQQSLSEIEFERGIWNAAICNEVSRIQSFVLNGKTNDKDNYGYTALHYAARNNNEEICKMLIVEGQANVNAVTKGGVTPLHRASMMGHLNIVKLLIQNKADLLIQDEDGQTALHRASQNNHLEICEYLQKNCADLIKIKDKKGNVPYDLLTAKNKELKLLLKP
ncbi:ankyrin repeat domain-containing protein 39 [Condylostylus longicornis]|uniref:ankyrin repeat domain-containing protein 39 n=1 Tax=Condylostylus longicornis TaxID=2530218 RepID=UPI00244DB39C|nr:ankyrin repeat domain-containing protein 39 [Condylostylus longicornis]